MSRPDMGRRIVCDECGAKYYSLNRPSPTCPKCGAAAPEDEDALTRSKRKRRAAKTIKARVDEPADEVEEEVDEDAEEDEDEEEDDVEEVVIDEDTIPATLGDEDDDDDGDLSDLDDDDDDLPDDELDLDGVDDDDDDLDEDDLDDDDDLL